ncbi:hypothetical protein GLP14_06015 [Photobacterium carnosum]|nr:hypothetical protein [Photobacterium carnosum]
MNPLERKIGRSKTIASLPNYTTAGSYCFFSQCVFLNSLEAKDLPSATNLNFDEDGSYSSILKFAPLLHHEAKHWYDAHSTLWGIKLIHQIYSGRNDLYVAEKSGIGTKLEHFNKQMLLRDTIELIKYPSYYQTTNTKANSSKPWKYTFSSGIIFSKNGSPSDRPIFFTRFINRENDLIARVPFSLCALLEASAVAQELNSKLIIINSIKDPVSKMLESNKFSESSFRELYDENLVEYSVVAHKVANSFSITDPIEAYNLSAKLVRLILNLPKSVVELLEPEKLLSKQFSHFFDAYKNVIKYHDLGALFSLFVDILFSKYQSTGIEVRAENLDELLNDLFSKNIGLTLDDINKLTSAEIESICEPVEFELESEYVNSVLTQSKSLYKGFGLVGTSFFDITGDNVPDFVLGDNTFFSSSGTTFDEFEKRYFNMTGYYEFLQEFSSACIV